MKIKFRKVIPNIPDWFSEEGYFKGDVLGDLTWGNIFQCASRTFHIYLAINIYSSFLTKSKTGHETMHDQYHAKASSGEKRCSCWRGSAASTPLSPNTWSSRAKRSRSSSTARVLVISSTPQKPTFLILQMLMFKLRIMAEINIIYLRS